MRLSFIAVAFFSVLIISSCANKKLVGIKGKADDFIKTLHLTHTQTATVDIKDSTLSFEIANAKDTVYSYSDWLGVTTHVYCFFINTYVVSDSIHRYPLTTLSYKSKANKSYPVGYHCSDGYSIWHHSSIARDVYELFWRCGFECGTYQQKSTIIFSVSIDSLMITETPSLRNFTDICAPLIYKYILKDSAKVFDKMEFYYSGRIGKKIKTSTIIYPMDNELFTKLH